MRRSLAKSYLVFFVSLVITGAGEAAPRILRDGFVIAGTDGRFCAADANDRYFFEIDTDVTDGRATLKKGERIELLPSAGLEKLIADTNNQDTDSYRLWGRITSYEGRNFVFPIYFLPVTEIRLDKAAKSGAKA